MDPFPRSLQDLLVRFWVVYCAIALCFVTVGNAEQQPLSIPKNAPKRVAIVGAGAAGSSSAYSLRKYADSLQIPVDITVFERDPYVGGRSTTVDVLDDPRYPIELGASIFVSVNYELVNASRDLGLTVQSASHARPKESDDTLGVWDGEQFVLVMQDTSSWWNIAKLIWRYGLAPIRTQSLMKSTVGKFLRLYEKPVFPFQSLTTAAAAVDLLNATASTGAAFLENGGVSADFARDVIQASTRVNYGQNLPVIHGLEAMVCMATDGAVSIAGGNWRIFHGMLEAAHADVRLNHTVTSIQRRDDGTLAVTAQPADTDADASTSIFDEVIIAGPLQYSGLSITPPPEHTPDEIPYVKLHVTLFSSPHPIAPQFFNLPAGARAPETILTTLPRNLDPNLDLSRSKADPGAGPAGFWSISTLRTVDVPRADGAPEKHYVYKIFSPERLTATFLEGLLGLERAAPANATIGALPARDLSWSREKIWNPYPVLFPRVTFEDPLLAPNIWYTGGIESFISTMETSALMGRNVAALISGGWEEGRSGRVGFAHGEL